jgi:hypothetical protein
LILLQSGKTSAVGEDCRGVGMDRVLRAFHRSIAVGAIFQVTRREDEVGFIVREHLRRVST